MVLDEAQVEPGDQQPVDEHQRQRSVYEVDQVEEIAAQQGAKRYVVVLELAETGGK